MSTSLTCKYRFHHVSVRLESSNRKKPLFSKRHFYTFCVVLEITEFSILLDVQLIIFLIFSAWKLSTIYQLAKNSQYVCIFLNFLNIADFQYVAFFSGDQNWVSPILFGVEPSYVLSHSHSKAFVAQVPCCSMPFVEKILVSYVGFTRNDVWWGRLSTRSRGHTVLK